MCSFRIVLFELISITFVILKARMLVRAYGPEKLLAELQAAGLAAGASPAPAGGPFARLVRPGLRAAGLGLARETSW